MKPVFDIVNSPDEDEIVYFIQSFLRDEAAGYLRDLFHNANGERLIREPIVELVGYLEDLESYSEDFWALAERPYDCLTNDKKMFWRIFEREALDATSTLLLKALNLTYTGDFFKEKW